MTAVTKMIDICGHCAPFCLSAIAGEHPWEGTSVDDHGTYCYGRMHAVDAIDQPATLYVQPASVYRHGAYPNTVYTTYQWKKDLGVQIAIEPMEAGRELLLSPAGALELAAYLTDAAHIAMGIDQPHPRLVR